MIRVTCLTIIAIKDLIANIFHIILVYALQISLGEYFPYAAHDNTCFVGEKSSLITFLYYQEITGCLRNHVQDGLSYFITKLVRKILRLV